MPERFTHDPGQPLVQAYLEEDLPVVRYQDDGNATLTAPVASGLPSEQFTYYGFFPRGKADQKATLEIVGQRDVRRRRRITLLGLNKLYRKLWRLEKTRKLSSRVN